jgi:hypothetical protein
MLQTVIRFIIKRMVLVQGNIAQVITSIFNPADPTNVAVCIVFDSRWKKILGNSIPTYFGGFKKWVIRILILAWFDLAVVIKF